MGKHKLSVVFLLCCLWTLFYIAGYSYITGRHDKKSKPRFHKDILGNIGHDIVVSTTIQTTLTVKQFSYRKSTNLVKNILLWDKIWWFQTKQIKGPFCGFCKITTNRSELNSSDTAAVVINAWSKAPSNPPLSQQRRPEQLYVFWASESPERTLYFGNYKVNLDLYPHHYFNATMTFRRDSTFYNPIHRLDLVSMIRGLWHGVERNTDKLLAAKTRTAVIITSNCNYGSNVANRLKLTQDMVDLGLEVDLFGRCFKNKNMTMPNYPRDSKEFYRFLSQYKFYLAFENSLHCRDYITEKFLANGLAAGLLPIAYGARKEDYLAIAPPHSFVHVEDFADTKQLVKYIKYLDRNHTAYAEYFDWRNGNAANYYHHGKAVGYCSICRALHGIKPDDTRSYAEIYGTESERCPDKVYPGVNQTIYSVHEWWHANETKECLNYTRNVTP